MAVDLKCVVGCFGHGLNRMYGRETARNRLRVRETEIDRQRGRDRDRDRRREGEIWKIKMK